MLRFVRRLGRLVRFRAANDDLREEIEHHRGLVEASFRERGLSPQDARDAASRAMGNETYMREESRAVWIWPGLESIGQDVRYALRGLRRSPAFASIAVISLALGIGANTAIFSLIHSLLLARVPVRAPEQLVSLQRDLGAKGTDERLSHAEFDALSRAALPLTMFASRGTTMDIDGVTVNISLDAVDGHYFDLMGVRAQRGRLISAADNSSQAEVAVITDRFWHGRLNADPGVLGRTVKISGHALTIVGVMPPRFAGLRFPAFIDVTIPYATATTLGILRETNSHRPFVTVVGRRGARQSLESAQRELKATWNACCSSDALVTLPKSLATGSSRLDVVDVSRGIPQMKLNLRGQYSRILLALMAGVGILLLAACANVANLLLARSSARSGELAVRLALGASRARLVMQPLIESLLLSLLGAVGGWLLAQWGAAVLSRVNVGDLSTVVAPAPGGSILLFTTTVSVVSGMIFGIIPAVRALRTDLVTPSKQGGRRSARGTRSWLDRGLVAGQIALALLLVSGAALLVQTLRNLERADLGFDPTNRFALSVETRGTSYEKQGMTAGMTDELLRRVRAIPGVEAAGFGSLVPVHGGRNVSDLVTVRGAPPLPAGDAETWFIGVTPGYFASLGIPIVAGRDIDPPTASMPRTAIRSVVINERFAKKFFPAKDPIGQTFQDHDEGDTVVTENRVVGVVADMKFSGLRVSAQPAYFVPVTDHDWPFLTLVVKPSRGGTTMGATISRAIAATSPGIAIGEPTSLSASIDAALIRERMSAVLATLFGLIALSLVAVGLYGVMLYQVTERTAEFGIRMALGARGASLIGLVLRQSLAIVVVGVAIGAPLAILAGRAVASQLYGVAPYDASALLVAAGSLVLVAMAASLVPVRRAMGVDPITALRAE